MKRFITAIIFLSSLVAFSGCGPRAFTKGDYDDPENKNLLNDQFSESDMQHMVKKLVDSMVAHPSISRAPWAVAASFSPTSRRGRRRWRGSRFERSDRPASTPWGGGFSRTLDSREDGRSSTASRPRCRACMEGRLLRHPLLLALRDKDKQDLN